MTAWNDFNDAEQQQSGFDLIPKGAIVPVRMTLKPTVLDGSDITLTAKDGTLTVAVTPATSAAAQAATVALPQLETALAEHAPAFRHVSVALVARKGKIDETA